MIRFLRGLRFSVKYLSVGLLAYCNTPKGLTKPAGPLQRNIIGTYHNYDRYISQYNRLVVAKIILSEENGKLVGKYESVWRQSKYTRGVESRTKAELYNPIHSEDEIIFKWRLLNYCNRKYRGEFDKKITDWKQNELEDPVCRTKDEIETVNNDKHDFHLHLQPNDELWSGPLGESIPLKFRKIKNPSAPENPMF